MHYTNIWPHSQKSITRSVRFIAGAKYIEENGDKNTHDKDSNGCFHQDVFPVLCLEVLQQEKPTE